MDLYHEIYLIVSSNRRDLPRRLWLVSGLTLGRSQSLLIPKISSTFRCHQTLLENPAFIDAFPSETPPFFGMFQPRFIARGIFTLPFTALFVRDRS